MITNTNSKLFCLGCLCFWGLSGCSTVSEQVSPSHPHAYQPDPELPIQAFLDETLEGPPEELDHETYGLHQPKKISTQTPDLMPAIQSLAKEEDPLPLLASEETQTIQNEPIGNLQLVTQKEKCLPELDEWKAEFTRQAQQTDQRLNALQTKLNVSTEQIARMELEHQNSKSEIESLKIQLEFYRKEVTRLERLMETQHSSDLVLLDALSSQLEILLSQSRSVSVE